MIAYQEFKLDNGLRLIHHHDDTTAVIAFNLLYDVGAKDEDEDKTGFAHLFEHLMFGGSVNIPNFDQPLQMVGGENNAFTSNDMTNYYITIPKQNIETAFWLESDRMLNLAFTPKSLEVQRQVVIEEFKQRYLNQPYGDAYLLLRPLAYKNHPYKWATIGKEISHIEEAKMEDVKAFFNKHYQPSNAILAIAGDIDFDRVKELAIKWFGGIPNEPKPRRDLAKEEVQTEARTLTVEREVPLNAIYYAYHMQKRNHPEYYVADLISDLLSRGNSSRFYQKLVKEQQLFVEINAYVSGDIDEGLFIITAKLASSVSYEEAEKAIRAELEDMIHKGPTESELQKVKNKVESSEAFAKTSALNKAMGLAISALIDSPDMVNTDLQKYQEVSIEDIQEIAAKLFNPSNKSTLYYKAKSNGYAE